MLALLSGRFAPDGHVVMNGCNFAAGESGEHMLYVLNQIVGVPVTGSIQVQSQLIPGLDGTTVTQSEDADGYPVRSVAEKPIADGALEVFSGVYSSAYFGAIDLWDWVFGEDQ